MFIRLLAVGVLVMLTFQVSAAESKTVSGVITNVNVDQRTITIRSDESGRRTYFFDEAARATSQGKPIALNRLRKGNQVTLHYRTTDRGRVIESVRLPDPDELLDVVPVNVSEVRTISGRVTGVRPNIRTITIRDDATRERRTLKIPETAVITRDGKPMTIRSIERGDDITARYRVTDRGLMLVTGRAPEAAAEPVSQAPTPTALPKTAGTMFAYLFAALGLFGASALIRHLRRRVA